MVVKDTLIINYMLASDFRNGKTILFSNARTIQKIYFCTHAHLVLHQNVFNNDLMIRKLDDLKVYHTKNQYRINSKLNSHVLHN